MNQDVSGGTTDQDQLHNLQGPMQNKMIGPHVRNGKMKRAEHDTKQKGPRKLHYIHEVCSDVVKPWAGCHFIIHRLLGHLKKGSLSWLPSAPF